MQSFKLIAAVAAVAALAACSSTPVATTSTTTAPAPVATAPAKTAPAQTAPAPAPAAQAKPMLAPHLDPNSDLMKASSVYFAFDKFAIDDKYKAVVEAHGKYIGANGALNVVVEGNADERGSREYNLALGNKRALAVKQGLTAMGAKDGQVEVVSYGEERPKAAAHDEAAWAENRRADVKYK